MFCDDEPQELPWDYFLNNYERDLLTLAPEDMVCKNPDRAPDEIKAEMERLRVSQAVFEGFGLLK
jgi:hypothetical protein